MDNSKIDKKDVIQNDFIKKFHILSLDVVLGALASGAFAVKLLHAEPGFAWWIILPISVWSIYSLDHLIDVISVNPMMRSIRNSYFHKYSRIIWTVIVLLIIMSSYFAFFWLDQIILRFGLSMGTIIAFYLWVLYRWPLSKSIFIQKEFYVAAFYASGIFGGLIALPHVYLSIHHWIIITNFFLLVFSDILILNFIESESISRNKPQSFIIKYGKRFSYSFIWSILVLVFAISIFEVFYVSDIVLYRAFKIEMLMTIALLVLLNYRDLFQKWPVYRIVGEMVFWLPAIVLLFNNS